MLKILPARPFNPFIEKSDTSLVFNSLTLSEYQMIKLYDLYSNTCEKGCKFFQLARLLSIELN